MNPMKVAALSLALAAGAAGDSSTKKQLVVSKLLKEKANVSLGKLTNVGNRTGGGDVRACPPLCHFTRTTC